MLDRFTQSELHALLRAHGGPQPSKSRALKLAKDLLNSDQGRVASVTLLEIQQTKCQIDINDDNAVAQLADRLIRELDVDALTPDYDDQGLIFPKLGIQIENTNNIDDADI
jgi:hypothetical protein